MRTTYIHHKYKEGMLTIAGCHLVWWTKKYSKEMVNLIQGTTVVFICTTPFSGYLFLACSSTIADRWYLFCSCNGTLDNTMHMNVPLGFCFQHDKPLSSTVQSWMILYVSLGPEAKSCVTLFWNFNHHTGSPHSYKQLHSWRESVKRVAISHKHDVIIGGYIPEPKNDRKKL